MAVLDQDTAEVAKTARKPAGGSLEDLQQAREKDVRDAIRGDCRTKLEACAKDAGTAMSAKDVEDYMRMGLTEDKLKYAKTEAEKTKELRKHRDDYVPLFVRQTKEAGRKALSLLEKARADKAISLENMAEWKQRMKNSKWDWKTRKAFIENQLPEFVFNWKMVAAKRRKLLRDPRMAALKTSDIVGKSDLQQFLSGSAFLNADYERRKALVALIEGAFLKLGNVPPMDKLKMQARAKLEAAVRSGGLASNKIDGWMQRIFKRNWSPQKISSFLTGEAWNDLPQLAHRWTEAREHFDKVDDRIKKEGAPRGLYVVSLPVFLGMQYEERMEYIEKAERSFTMMEIAEKGERTELNGLKLDIGHAMHMKDWEEANALLGDALKKFPDDLQLLSMQASTKLHVREDAKQTNAKDQAQRLRQAQEENEQMIDMFPDSEKEFIAQAGNDIDPNTLKRVAQLWYNPHWCERRGYLNEEIIHDQRTSDINKEKTRQYQNYGHSRMYEANIIEGDTAKKEAIRDDCRKPQVLHVQNTREAKQAAYTKIRENRNNEWFGYWTSYIPEGLSLEKHKYLSENCFYKFKRNKRLLDAHGATFTRKKEEKVLVA